MKFIKLTEGSLHKFLMKRSFFFIFSGITVCAVAIGSGVNMAEINGIATENCVFQLPSFSTYREANAYAYAQKFGAKSSAQQKGKV